MEKTLVFYDGSCPICVGASGWLSRIDHKEQFRLEPYQNQELLKQYPQINPADCELEIHVITEHGKLLRGAGAMMEIWGKSSHWSSFMAYPLSFPPFIWLARPVYRLVARYRKSIY